MLDCYLDCTHRVRHTLPFCTPIQIHDFVELTYFISGKGSTKIGEKVYPYKKKTFAVYHAGTPHYEDDPEPCDVIWTHFSYRIDGIFLREGVFEDPHGELLLLIQKLRRISLESDAHRDALVESCLAEVIITAARLQKRAETGHTPSTDWQRVLDYIDENSHTDIDFAELAASHHYSYDRFRHLFREKFGASPYSYLLGQRIERAEYLLSSTKANLTEVAYDCGFASSSQFTNIFKKHTGMTPGAFRRAHMKNKMFS